MSNDTAMKNFNTRMSVTDLERLETLRERLQARLGPNIKVSYRIVLAEAMDRLEQHLDRLERDKSRSR